MPIWRTKEIEARRAIEDAGFIVHDANVLFRQNCPNIDLVVFGKASASYVQVKSSNNPATKDGVIVDGAPWTLDQLFFGGPIFNRHEGSLRASFVLVIDTIKTGAVDYYIAPPYELERAAIRCGRDFMARRKRNGEWRKMFRKEIPREMLSPWSRRWSLFGELAHGHLMTSDQPL